MLCLRLSIVFALTAAFADANFVRVAWALEPGPVDKDAPKRFTSTASGLKYRVLRKSNGDKPTAHDEVTVHFRERWDDGTRRAVSRLDALLRAYEKDGQSTDYMKMANTYKLGRPITFSLDGRDMSPELIEGVQLVGKGGMIELVVPSKLVPAHIDAAGNVHHVELPGRRFLVELVDMEKRIAGKPGAQRTKTPPRNSPRLPAG